MRATKNNQKNGREDAPVLNEGNGQAMPSLKALLFDLDGTLVNTGPLIVESFRHAAKTVLGLEAPPQELIAAVGTPLASQMRGLVDRHFGEQLPVDGTLAKTKEELTTQLLEVYREYCARVHDEYILPYEGVETVLQNFARRGVPMGVVTSKLHHSAVADLAYYDLKKYFQILVGADDVSEHKPLPMPLLKGMELLSTQHEICLTPQDCAYIGDSPFDTQAGNSAGMHTVAVTYGLFEPESLLAQHPDEIFSSPIELNSLETYLSL